MVQSTAVSTTTWSTFRSQIKYLPVEGQGNIRDAFELACKLHENQKRLSGEPYVTHCITVANFLVSMGADEETIIAALLHDAVEDTPITLDKIESQFGSSVASLVEGATKFRKEDMEGSPTLDDRIETLRKIFVLMEEDVRIIVLKLVDRLHNMQTVEFIHTEKQKMLARQTRDTYVKIADRLCMQDIRDELEELCLAVLDLDLLEKLRSFRLENEKQGKKVMEDMSRSFRMATPQMDVDMVYEHKKWEKLRIQLDTVGSTITGVSTLTVVLLCEDIPSCYEILGSLHQNWRRETLSFQDFINSPQINGYQGLHTTIIMENGTRVRCKIRTREMHGYARKGVSDRCFDNQAMGLLQYVPWARHISPLAADTAERSEDFWDSLSSDILGESIMVHTSDDRVVPLPDGATALDGAFYCFGERAQRVKSIRVNGKEVPFQYPLKRGVSLEIELRTRPTVGREWLQLVRTGLAQAQIRSGIAKRPHDAKADQGRSLLQDIMVEKRKGLIEEFSEESIFPGIKSLGFKSIDEAYVAAAEGRLEPLVLYAAVFEREKSKKSKSVMNDVQLDYKIRFAIDRSDIDIMRRLVDVYEKYNVNMSNIRIWSFPFSNVRYFSVSVRLSQEEIDEFCKNIERLGARNVSITYRFSAIKYLAGVGLLLVLWGIDPVVARLLVVDYAVSPIDLTLIRFWTLMTLCGVTILFKITSGKMKDEVWISLKNVWIWFSAIALVLVASSTYFALQQTWPSHYTIPMTAAGLVLTSIQNKKRLPALIAMWSLFAAGFAVLVFGDSTWTLRGIVMTIAAVAGFTLFSVVSERYKREENVAGRVLQYFFVLSCVCFVFSLPLLAFSTIREMSTGLIFSCFLFSALIASLPYYLYYYALSHKQIDFVLRYSFLIIFASVIGQILVFGEINRLIVLSGLLVIAGALFPMICNLISRVKENRLSA